MFRLDTAAETSSEKAATFNQIMEAVHPWFDALCEMLQVPDLAVTAVVADDFTGAVTRATDASASSRLDRTPFTVERLGGNVTAKNIPMSTDYAEVHVIFDASFLDDVEAMAVARGIYFGAHEFTHSLVCRLRHETGSLPPRDPGQSQTPNEAARAIMRCALDEWRADHAANLILSKLVTVGTNDSDRRGAGGPDVAGASYIQHVGNILDTVVYPGWPDLVSQYRHHEIQLMDIWLTLATQAEQTFILLAHAQAEAEHLQIPNALAEAYANHPGATLYLGPAWSEMRAAVAEYPLLPERDDFRTYEYAILDRTERALVEMWGRLGLTFEDKPDLDTYAIWVKDPLYA